MRYYVQEGLLPPPSGPGRGAHYGPGHLERLLQVRSMQERGMSLLDIQLALRNDGDKKRQREFKPAQRSSWTRIELAPGIELHLAESHRVPSPGGLAQLTEWCRRHIRRDRQE